MSHKNYTQYSNKRPDFKKVEQPVVVEKKIEDLRNEPIPEEAIIPHQGCVTDCENLNIREEPSLDAGIVGTISGSTNLMVYEEESTDDFYKICTTSGVEGFCMKRYITLMP